LAKRDSVKRTALVLVFVTILSKLFGFGREIVLAHYYGASSITDAYIIALTIPTTLFVLIGRGVATSYIPIYTNIEKNRNVVEADIFTSNLINIIMLISTAMILFSLVFTEQIVKIFASCRLQKVHPAKITHKCNQTFIINGPSKWKII
jgi:putative peptidoglycan lipid II flippase